MERKKTLVNVICKIIITAIIIPLVFFTAFFIALLTSSEFLVYALVVLYGLFIPITWFKNRKKVLILWSIFFIIVVAVAGIKLGMDAYDRSIKINTTPNISVDEYLPFDEESKIAVLDNESSLKFEDNLPVLDGAAAVFPVYSSFINAVYPETTELWDGVFEYNNTVGGYKMLGEKRTDIFFGGYPSEEQIAEAKAEGTEFIYTPIAKEAFVFFVHKDNPIDNLTTEQVQAIYSGEITNWKEVGGANEKIVAYQRNEGSGSQSMLIRFMNGKEIMEAPTETVNDLMSGIVEQVSDYRSKSSSIGFSFRYYLEGIIQNPDIKILSIDGIAPTVENIKNGTYPITGEVYAVTWEGNDNENVDKLLEWILSDEGQELIEKSGYVRIN